MGCDIHVHIEVKLDGRWEHYANPSVLRHYTLFTLLANVRSTSEIKPISEPRGLPEDCNGLTRYELEHGEYHSHSYLDLKDLKKANKTWIKYMGMEDWTVWGALFGEEQPYLFDDWKDSFPFDNRDPKIEDVRIVFAFDS